MDLTTALLRIARRDLRSLVGGDLRWSTPDTLMGCRPPVQGRHFESREKRDLFDEVGHLALAVSGARSALTFVTSHVAAQLGLHLVPRAISRQR